MKTLSLMVILSTVLVGCSAPQKTNTPEPLTLTPPSKTAIGFVQLGKDVPYYVDSASVWVDEIQKHLINFDTVLNLKQGEAVFDNKKLFSHSIREHKTLDCQKQKLTHRDRHLYSEFWGKGHTVEAKDQNYSVNLKSGSTLGIVGQILCANFYRQ
ncbi:MAG: surface-adhesin E family protein [Lonepinella koalarum]|nr:surface-adhesin E family protein [Lonepinella koalarum]